jgi:hypothetical protein
MFKIFKFKPLIIIAVLLQSCNFGSNFQINYQDKNQTVKLLEVDKNNQDIVTRMISKFQSFSNNYDSKKLALVQLYYRSFIDTLKLYGDRSFNENALWESQRDFLVTPVDIFDIKINEIVYTTFLSRYSIYRSNNEKYSPSIQVFKKIPSGYVQINVGDEFCPSTSNRCTREWSYFNDLYSGKVNGNFIFQSIDSFLVNEIIFTSSYLTFSYPFYDSLRIMARYFQYENSFKKWQLGIEFGNNFESIKIFRRRERVCSPSLSNCQEIITQPYESITINFIKKEVYYFSTYRWYTPQEKIFKLSPVQQKINISEKYQILLEAQSHIEFLDEFRSLKYTSNNPSGLNDSEIFSFIFSQLF